MSEVTLSAAVRESLLSLQRTANLVDRTQSRLSTGLKVASPIDDPIAFFQAKTLSDRAADLNDRKSDIDQGISQVTAALDGVNGIDSLVRQLKGVANSLKSATNSQATSLISQFNDLRTQIDNLANDTSFQGTNLINSTATTLKVEFSDRTASSLTVQGVNIKSSALGISQASTAATLVAVSTGGSAVINTAGRVLGFTFSSASNVTLISGNSVSVTIAGNSAVAIASGLFTFSYGGETLTLFVDSQGLTFSADKLTKFTVYRTNSTVAGGISASQGFGIVLDSGVTNAASVASALAVGDVNAQTETLTLFNNSTAVTDIISEIDTALATLRTNSQTLGNNVALLTTRLDFTETYVNTLEDGSAKLTLADINEEGANLLALQTRQQLAITSLSFAGQAEQGILTLFR